MHQNPFSPAAFGIHFINGPDVPCCFTAEAAGQLLGFRSLGRYPDLPGSEGDIGTFTDPALHAKGNGAALFAQTRPQAAVMGLSAVHAVVRADNVAGLSYQQRMGLRLHHTHPAVLLADGTPVDRPAHVFHLNR